MAARKKRSRVWLERAVIAVLVLCIGAELVYWFRHRAVPGADVSAPEWVEQDILPLNPYSRPGTPLETIDGVVDPLRRQPRHLGGGKPQLLRQPRRHARDLRQCALRRGAGGRSAFNASRSRRSPTAPRRRTITPFPSRSATRTRRASSPPRRWRASCG